ncbi:MAG: hypothetical protein ABR923_05900 [Terracidiphilus sp.]|jgi:hypothetical protein
MHLTSGNRYQRRPNPDGTHDSICCICFETVGTGTEFNVAEAERAHRCDPFQEYRAGQLAADTVHNRLRVSGWSPPRTPSVA